MTGLIIILTLILLIIVVVQIGRVTELAAKIRGEEKVAQQSNDRTAFWLLVFMIVFLGFCFVSAYMFKNYMLGYGPHKSASAHGVHLDGLFNVTLIFTGIVFVITHIALFWFGYKYRRKANRKAIYFPHNNTLELVWTVIPSIVLVYLVVQGLIVWNEVMPDVNPDEEYIEVEATGYQFAWDLRYPGPDGKLGTKDFKLINLANNPLGQDWSDEKNIDDFHASELVLPVGKKVRVRITSRDVLHNFYLPHFRVKMDAIPGLPTYFIFTPTKTTAEYRQELRNYAEWKVPADESDPDGPEKWEMFEYELACAELCGTGHYSMRRLVKIVTEEEYIEWMASQPSYYMQNIRNTEDDPLADQLLGIEISDRARILMNEIDEAINSEASGEMIVVLKHVWFESGSATLMENSKYELDNLARILNENLNLTIEIGGHSFSEENSPANLTLSAARADQVKAYLENINIDPNKINTRGYGDSMTVTDSDQDSEGMNEDRIEMKIIAQ